MSLPPPNHACWHRLVSGGVKLQTDQLALQLMCSRISRSAAPVDQRIRELRAFFVRFERVLTREIGQLVKL